MLLCHISISVHLSITLSLSLRKVAITSSSLSLSEQKIAMRLAPKLMELAVFLVVFLAIVQASDATWCICQGSNETALQSAIDYACGHGADCAPIMENGACYNPNTVQAHCSYAANSYYQRKSEDSTACDFGGTATTTTTDPSTSGCTYPATPSAANAGSSNSTSNGTAAQPTSSIYGMGPSAVPEGFSSGFRPETRSAFWTLSFIFVLIVNVHCKA